MRIWTLHPKYLDTKGLLAAWREALLAQAVLREQTRGYKNHAQLIRFKQQFDPCACIGAYLQGLYAESVCRGYRFDKSKISPLIATELILATEGQVLYEWRHLQGKLKQRDAKLYEKSVHIIVPEPHPLFRIVPGGIQAWERVDT